MPVKADKWIRRMALEEKMIDNNFEWAATNRSEIPG